MSRLDVTFYNVFKPQAKPNSKKNLYQRLSSVHIFCANINDVSLSCIAFQQGEKVINALSFPNLSRALQGKYPVKHMLRDFEKFYPLASRVLNREEVIRGGIMTRFLVGTARVYINRPVDNRKVELTRSQKYQSFFERFFVEIIGIPLQVMTMFATQEGVSRLYKRSGYVGIPSLKQIAKEAAELETTMKKPGIFAPQHFEAIQNAIKEEMRRVVSPIAHKIYSPDRMRTSLQKVPLTMLSAIKTFPKEGADLKQVKELAEFVIERYTSRLRVGSAVTMVGGILAGAIVGGYFIQWMNDNLFSTKIVPKMLKSIGILPNEPGKTVYVKHHVPSINERTFVV